MCLCPPLRYKLLEGRGLSVLFTAISPVPSTVLGTKEASVNHGQIKEKGPRPDLTYFKEEEKGCLSSPTPSHQDPAAHILSLKFRRDFHNFQ